MCVGKFCPNTWDQHRIKVTETHTHTQRFLTRRRWVLYDVCAILSGLKLPKVRSFLTPTNKEVVLTVRGESGGNFKSV